MSYVTLSEKDPGGTITSNDWEQIRQNFMASAVAAMVAKGDLFFGTGSKAGARVPIGSWGHILIPNPNVAAGAEWHPQPICKVRHDAAQDPTVDDWFTLAYNTENMDSGSLHSTTVNNSRITVPVDGCYRVRAAAEFKTSDLASGTSGVYGIRFLVDGVTVIEPYERFEEETMGINTTRSVGDLLSLNAGQYIEAQVYTNRDVDVTDKVVMWLTFDRVQVV